MTQALDSTPLSAELFGVHVDVRHRAVHLAGELDMASVPTLREAATTLLEAGPADFTVDLASLSFIDSQGINLLQTIKTEQHRRGVRLVLTGVSARLRYVLAVAGSADLLAPLVPA